MFLYPPPFYGPIHHSPVFPYNTGAFPEYAATPGSMPGIRPAMGTGMPMHPGLSPMTPGMGYYPGMGAPHMGLDPNVMTLAGQAMGAPSTDKASRGSGQASASRPKPFNGHGVAYPDSRKDVRFASASATPPNLTQRQLNYAGWRYPAGQGGYFSQEHTPASSVMPSPAVDAANPMDIHSPDGMAYPQYGHYGYSPYPQYPSYPNTPSIRSAAGYNAQMDPFTFEEMSEAVNQPNDSSQQQHGGANLQDRRKKSWYGPRQ